MSTPRLADLRAEDQQSMCRTEGVVWREGIGTRCLRRGRWVMKATRWAPTEDHTGGVTLIIRDAYTARTWVQRGGTYLGAMMRFLKLAGKSPSVADFGHGVLLEDLETLAFAVLVAPTVDGRVLA